MSVSSTIKFNELLIKAAQHGVSDLHLSIGANIKARVNGVLLDWHDEVVSRDFLDDNILSILDDEQQRSLKENGSIVLCHNFSNNLRFRIQIILQEGKISAVLRFIPNQIKEMDELGLPKIIEDICSLSRGLVIISGPAGAGKTTTIAAMIQEINLKSIKKIITLEEPIEFIFQDNKSLIEQRQIKKDSPSFKVALKDLVSSDVEVVVVSCLRGAQSASQILELSEQCLVILELCSQSIIDSIEDFLNFFSESEKISHRQVLSRNLVAVFNQILVPIRGGGRFPIVEILLNTTPVAAAIFDNHLARIPEIITSSGAFGMVSKERSLAELVKSERVLFEEALKYVRDKEGFKEMILK